jgi:hypothetical protein
MKYFARTCIFILFIAFAWGGCIRPGQGPSTTIKIGKQTTWITTPLDENGLPDYAAWLLERQRARVADRPNAAIPFWQAMWPSDYDVESQRLVRAELGDSIPNDKGSLGPFDTALRTELRDWLVAYWIGKDEISDEQGDFLLAEAESRADDLLYELISRPFNEESIAPIATWIERHHAGCELLDAAAKCNDFYTPSPSLLKIPPDPLVTMDQSCLQSLRAAERILMARAMYHAGRQEYEEAWTSCITGFRLADFCRTGKNLVAELTACACRAQCLETTAILAQQKGISAELLRRMLSDLDRISQPINMLDSITIGERLIFLDVICRLASGRTNGIMDDAEQDFTKRMAGAPFDWNLVLEMGNTWYDDFAAAMMQQRWTDRQQALDAIDKRLEQLATSRMDWAQLARASVSRKTRSELIGNVMISMMLPATSAAAKAQDRVNTECEITRLAVALEFYRCEHGQYPESLRVLAPDILPEVPRDLYHNKPYRYRRTQGGYLLYSEGPNGVNDRGDCHDRQHLRGYGIDHELDQADLRQILVEELGELEQGTTLAELISQSADDIGIRMPLPQQQLPTRPQ